MVRQAQFMVTQWNQGRLFTKERRWIPAFAGMVRVGYRLLRPDFIGTLSRE